MPEQQIPTLLGFYPYHFKTWADSIERDIKYESMLCVFLRKLAKQLEEGKIKEV